MTHEERVIEEMKMANTLMKIYVAIFSIGFVIHILAQYKKN